MARQSPMETKAQLARQREWKKYIKAPDNPVVVRERSRNRKIDMPAAIAAATLHSELMKRAVLHRRGRHDLIAMRESLIPLSEL